MDAEDAGGAWRTAYLTPGRLVEATGAAMLELLGALLPHSSAAIELDGGRSATVAAAASLLRAAPCIVVLLGSGASASYGVPTKLAASTENVPLKRYGPVRETAMRAPTHGLYGDLKRLLAALDAESCIVSTNIDGLATREGLKELQLHGTTARMQCAACQTVWPTPAGWSLREPPTTCSGCGRLALFNLPTNVLDEDDIVWRDIERDRDEARAFLDAAAGAPLAFLAIGTATHVHSLTPELRLVVEARAARGDATQVVWVNRDASGLDRAGYGRGPLELLGDAAEVVGELAGALAHLEESNR